MNAATRVLSICRSQSNSELGILPTNGGVCGSARLNSEDLPHPLSIRPRMLLQVMSSETGKSYLPVQNAGLAKHSLQYLSIDAGKVIDEQSIPSSFAPFLAE